MRRTTLRYTACECTRRGVCFAPGMRGHLVVQVRGKIIPVHRCRYCK